MQGIHKKYLLIFVEGFLIQIRIKRFYGQLMTDVITYSFQDKHFSDDC